MSGRKESLQTSDRNPSVPLQSAEQNYYNVLGSQQMYSYQEGNDLSTNSTANMPIFPEPEKRLPASDSRSANASKNINADLYAQALAVKSSLGLLDASNSSALETLRSYGPSSNFSRDSPPVNQRKNYLSHSQALDASLYDDSSQHALGFPDRLGSSIEYYNQADSDSNASCFARVKPILDLNLTSVDDEDEFLYGDSNPSLAEPESSQKPSAPSPQVTVKQKELELTEWNDDERGINPGKSQYSASSIQFSNSKADKKQINVKLKKQDNSINLDRNVSHPSNCAKDVPHTEKKDYIASNQLLSGDYSGKYGNAAIFLRKQLNLDKPQDTSILPLELMKTRLAEFSASSRKHISDSHERDESLYMSLNDKQNNPELTQRFNEMEGDMLRHSKYQMKNPDRFIPQLVNYSNESDRKNPSHANEIHPEETKSTFDLNEKNVPPKNYRKKEVEEYIDEHPAEKLKRAFNQGTHFDERSPKYNKETSRKYDLSGKNRPRIHDLKFESEGLRQRSRDRSPSDRNQDYSPMSYSSGFPKFGLTYQTRESPKRRSADRSLGHSKTRDRSRSPIRHSEQDYSRSPERLYRPKSRGRSPAHKDSSERSSRRSWDRSPNEYSRKEIHSSDRSPSPHSSSIRPKKYSHIHNSEYLSDDVVSVPINKESVKANMETALTPAISMSSDQPKQHNVKTSTTNGISEASKRSNFSYAERNKMDLVDYNKIIFSSSVPGESDGKNQSFLEIPASNTKELFTKNTIENQVADNLKFLIQLGQMNQLLDNFTKFSKQDSVPSNAAQKDRNLTLTSNIKMPPPNSNQLVSKAAMPTHQLPESNPSQQSQTAVNKLSESLQLSLAMYSRVPPPTLSQVPQPIYSQASQSLYPPTIYSQAYGLTYPQEPNSMSGPTYPQEPNSMSMPAPVVHSQPPMPVLPQESLVSLQPTMYPSYPYTMPPNISYPTPDANFPYNPSYSSAVSSPMPLYSYRDATPLPPTSDFVSPAKIEKKLTTRVCSLKSVPILSDDQTNTEAVVQEKKLSAALQKASWTEIMQNQKQNQSSTAVPSKNTSTLSSSLKSVKADNADEIKTLDSKLKKLLDERDVIKKDMQNSSNYTMELRKKKEDLEKKMRGSKNCTFSDWEVVKHYNDLYNKANEKLKNFIDEAKQINYKVKEMQSKIESFHQKTEKKTEPEKEDHVAAPTITYSCYDTGNHWCEHCSKSFSTLAKIMEHLHSTEHLKHIDPFKVSADNETIKENKSTNFNSTLHPVQGVEFMKPMYAYHCSLCNATLRNRGFAELHLKGHDHTVKYMNYTKENPNYARKRELIKTARIAALVKEKRRKDLELKQMLRQKKESGTENRVKAMLQEQKNNEKKGDELDESKKEVGGGKRTLVPEKEKTNKDEKNINKQNVIYIGRAPNYKSRSKLNIRKLSTPNPSAPKKSKLMDDKDSVIAKIIEEINDPNSGRTLSKIPVEKTDTISAPVPSKGEQSSVIESLTVEQNEKANSNVSVSQSETEARSEAATKPLSKPKDDNASDKEDAFPKKNKLPESGCQTESEAKLSKEDKGQDFPSQKPSSKKGEKKKHDPYEPKTGDPVVDQALKNILYGSNSGSVDLSGIELPKSLPRSSASHEELPPMKKKKHVSQILKPDVRKPLTEEERDFLLLGICKSDLEPIAVPRPPPPALIQALPEIALNLPPFPPPLSIPPPSLVLQRSSVCNVSPKSNQGTSVSQHTNVPNQNSNKPQATAPVSDCNVAVVDMEIDDEEADISTSIIVHDPLATETSNSKCLVSDPEFVDSSSAALEVEAVSTCKGSKLESPVEENSSDLNVCKTVVDLLVSDVTKHFYENGEGMGNDSSTATENSIVVLEGESTPDSCPAEPLEINLTDKNVLGNQNSLIFREKEISEQHEQERVEPCLKPSSDSQNAEYKSLVSENEQNEKLPSNSAQSGNEIIVGTSSSLKQKTLAEPFLAEDSIRDNISPSSTSEIDVRCENSNNSTRKESTLQDSVEKPQNHPSEETESSETTFKSTCSSAEKNENTVTFAHSQVFSDNIVKNEGNISTDCTSSAAYIDLPLSDNKLTSATDVEMKSPMEDEIGKMLDLESERKNVEADMVVEASSTSGPLSREVIENASENELMQPIESTDNADYLDGKSLKSNSMSENGNIGSEMDTYSADVSLPAEPVSNQIRELEQPPELVQSVMQSSPCHPTSSTPKSCEDTDESEKDSKASKLKTNPEECDVQIKVEPEEPSANMHDQEILSLDDLDLEYSTKLAVITSMILPPMQNKSDTDYGLSRPVNVAEALSRNRLDLLIANRRYLDVERAIRQRTSQLLRSSSSYTQLPTMKFRRGTMNRSGSGDRKRGNEYTSERDEESCSASEQSSSNINCSHASGNSEFERRDEYQTNLENHIQDEESRLRRDLDGNAFGTEFLMRNSANSSAPSLETFHTDDNVSYVQSSQAPFLGMFPLPRIFARRIEQELEHSAGRGRAAESQPSINQIERDLLSNLTLREQLSVSRLGNLLGQASTQGGVESSVVNRTEENDLSRSSIKVEKDKTEEEAHSSIAEKSNMDEGTSIKVEKVKVEEERLLDIRSNEVEGTEKLAQNVSVAQSKNTDSDVQVVFSTSARPRNSNEIPVIVISDSENEHSNDENTEMNKSKAASKKSSKNLKTEGKKRGNDSDTDEYEAN